MLKPRGYKGIMVELPGGGRMGLRLVSTSGGPAVDINIRDFIWKELHFTL